MAPKRFQENVGLREIIYDFLVENFSGCQAEVWGWLETFGKDLVAHLDVSGVKNSLVGKVADAKKAR